MATLTIKNIPDEVYEQLKQRAARHRRSVNSEVIVCLEKVLGSRSSRSRRIPHQHSRAASEYLYGVRH